VPAIKFHHLALGPLWCPPLAACASTNRPTVQGSTYCFWLCPRFWSNVGLFQGHLHSSGWHSLAGQTSFGSTCTVDMFMPCMDQNSARSAELSHCVAAPVVWNALPCLVDSSLSPPNIHQSRTIQSWSSSTKPTTPSKNIFILKVYFTVLRTYLLTYLVYLLQSGAEGWKQSGPENWMSGSEQSGVWKNTVERERKVAWAGDMKEVWAEISTAPAPLTCSGYSFQLHKIYKIYKAKHRDWVEKCVAGDRVSANRRQQSCIAMRPIHANPVVMDAFELPRANRPHGL